MRVLRGVIIAMTGTCAGATLWLAANSHPVDVGLLMMGLSVSVIGIFVIAFTGPTYEREGDNDR